MTDDTADKRSVHTDALATLGTIIGPEEGRDAIHLAVEPVQAAERLMPGQDIGLLGGLASGGAPQKVGIVDPFLRGAVSQGDWFWLIVYPRTITSLRHVWAHPDLPEGKSKPDDIRPLSQKWMDDFAGQFGLTASRMIEAATEFLDTSEYWSEGGLFEGERVPDEFWDHYQRITGRMVDSGDRESFFTCSC